MVSIVSRSESNSAILSLGQYTQDLILSLSSGRYISMNTSSVIEYCTATLPVRSMHTESEPLNHNKHFNALIELPP